MLSAASLLSASPLLQDEMSRLSPYRLHPVLSSTDPLFDAAYDALAAYFGSRGQLEARADLARLVDASGCPWICEGVAVVRPLLVLLSADGSLAAVAERYVAFDPASGLLSGLDANLLVLPAHRGQGLGPVLERLLVHAGRHLLLSHGAGPHRLGVELGDLEPLQKTTSVDDRQRARLDDSVRRVAVWAQNGYRLLPRSVFPLSLVGMQGDDGQAVLPPVPMLAILRVGISQDRSPIHSVEKTWLHTLANHLYAAHAWADPNAAAQERHLQQAALAAIEDMRIPLLALPQSTGAAIPDFLCLP